MQIKQVQISSSLDQSALTELEAIAPQAVLVFGNLQLMAAPGFSEALRQAFPDAARLGCSTAGEITAQGASEKTCVITALKFDGAVRLRTAEASIATMDECESAGEAIGRQLAAPDLRAVLLFGKGLGVNGSAIIQGLVSSLGPSIPITGGLAGDDGAFVSTLTLTPSGVTPDGLVGLGLYGDDLIIGHGSFGGWVAFGPARKVTRCEGNILFELDGEPALNVYKRYLGDYAKDLPASGLLFPFEMLNQNHDTMGLIRTILGIDTDQGSLVLAGDILADGYLRLMHASTDQLIEGADHAARLTHDSLALANGPGLAILVSCVGRRLVMGDQVDGEVEAVADVLNQVKVLTGFYSYGEISPFSDSTECKLHNQTMTITFLGER